MQFGSRTLIRFPHPPGPRIISALAGAFVWLVALLIRQPSPFDLGWSHALLLFAPLVLVPLALGRFNLDNSASLPWRTAGIFQLPAALLLGWSFLMPQGELAAILSLPWLATTGLLAFIGLKETWRHRRGPLADFCLDVALVYLGIGGFWTTLDRWGHRPLEFEGVIVLLTGIHFHYAGFVLPVLAGMAIRALPGKLARLSGLAVIAAVPLTAVGITTSQLGLAPLLEFLAAWFMALGGMLGGGLYCRLGLQRAAPLAPRVAFIVAGVSLLAGMVLAGLYGSRFYVSLPWLDIPWMRAIHGSFNAFGFSLAGILGWALCPSIKWNNNQPRTTDHEPP